MLTHYQRVWQFNLVVVWPLVWLAYTIQLILAGIGRQHWAKRR